MRACVRVCTVTGRLINVVTDDVHLQPSLAERKAEARLLPGSDRAVVLHSSTAIHLRSLFADWPSSLASRRPGLRQHFRRIKSLSLAHITVSPVCVCFYCCFIVYLVLLSPGVVNDNDNIMLFYNYFTSF